MGKLTIIDSAGLYTSSGKVSCNTANVFIIAFTSITFICVGLR